MMRFAAIGAIAMALAVAAGAFGAHALANRLSPEALKVWHTASAYHVYHALGLFAVDYAVRGGGQPRLATWAGYAMIAGLFLFSGSLYALALSGVRGLGAVTPLGGLAWIASWITLAVAIWGRPMAS
ncbi:MAG: DUF423 domain-containing protein [Myxococcales bacterium]|nr:DUF423 domain-containing protein [Myxococcales bacterium]